MDLETARNGSAVLRNAISTKNLEGKVKIIDLEISVVVSCAAVLCCAVLHSCGSCTAVLAFQAHFSQYAL